LELMLVLLAWLLQSRMMPWVREPCLRLGLVSFERREPVWMILLLVLHRLVVVRLVVKLQLRQRHLLVLLCLLFLLCLFRELCP